MTSWPPRIFDWKADESFREEFLKLSSEVLEEGFLTNHILCEKAEKIIEEQTGMDSILVNSGTGALEVALDFFNVRGKYVIIPNNTFIATAKAILKCGGIPLIVDVEESRFTMSLEGIKEYCESLTQRTIGAVIFVHIGSHISEQIIEISNYLKNQNIPLIEDAAHVWGATLNGHPAGHYSDIACYSLFTTKILTCGEGGIVSTGVTGNKLKLKSIRQFGKSEENSRVHEDLGGNHKLGELQAALLICDLMRVKKRVQIRQRLAELYQKNLNENFRCLKDSENSKGSYYKQVVICNEESQKLEIARRLENASIPLTGTVYRELLSHQPILNSYFSSGDFPVSELFAKTHFCPPVYPELSEESVERICEVINECH